VSSVVGGLVLFLCLFLGVRFLHVGRVRARMRRRAAKGKMKEERVTITGPVQVRGSGPIAMMQEAEAGEGVGKKREGVEMVPIVMLGGGHRWDGEGNGNGNRVGSSRNGGFEVREAASVPGSSVRYFGGKGSEDGRGGQQAGFI
jgi:hypothetical protein